MTPNPALERTADQRCWWVAVAIPAIFSEAIYERVRQRREARAPATVSPRLVSSPILLSGLIRCGQCGAGMTVITGKSGRYKYYRCTSRVSKSDHVCTSPNVPMEKLDALVIEQLANRIFTAERLTLMLTEARRMLKLRRSTDQDKLAKLQTELRTAEERLNRLYEAVESGVLNLDDTLQRRAQQLKAAREAVLIEMAGIRRSQALPERVMPSQISAFSKAVRAKLRDRSSTFARDYLRAVVSEIRVQDGAATISGSYERLFSVVAGKEKDTGSVPISMRGWRPHGNAMLFRS